MVRHAQCNGHEVTVLDNFSTGHRWAVQDVEVLDIDLLDKENLLKILIIDILMALYILQLNL